MASVDDVVCGTGLLTISATEVCVTGLPDVSATDMVDTAPCVQSP